MQKSPEKGPNELYDLWNLKTAITVAQYNQINGASMCALAEVVVT